MASISLERLQLVYRRSEQLGTWALSLSGECHQGPRDLEEGGTEHVPMLQRGSRDLPWRSTGDRKLAKVLTLGTTPTRVDLGPGLRSQ